MFGAVAEVDARPHPLQSSCALTEIDVGDSTGARHALLLKDPSCRSQEAGPQFLYDDRREFAAYRALAGRGLALPRLLRASIDPGRGRCWLLLQRVEGVPLWQSGDPLAWCAAAEWLAELHALRPIPERPPWLRYDRAFYGLWMERALAFAPAAGLAGLEAVHASAIARLSAAPSVIVHGDYYPSNVLVCSPHAPRACPLDLELAGIGPAALDLAALTAGLREPLSASALGAYQARVGGGPAREELQELVWCARLHLAIRWLGWMPRRRPPAHQQFDWAAEAHAAAGALQARSARVVTG
jgi:aminoglycoside phosphotransferase (APT) family kinase protein